MQDIMRASNLELLCLKDVAKPVKIPLKVPSLIFIKHWTISCSVDLYKTLDHFVLC